jgi:hypothetical protein
VHRRGSILVNDLMDLRKNGGFLWIKKLEGFFPCLWGISTCWGLQQPTLSSTGRNLILNSVNGLGTEKKHTYSIITYNA